MLFLSDIHDRWKRTGTEYIDDHGNAFHHIRLTPSREDFMYMATFNIEDGKEFSLSYHAYRERNARPSPEGFYRFIRESSKVYRTLCEIEAAKKT